MKPHVAVSLGLIRVYRYTFSAFAGHTCRYLPTCSEYAETAIGIHGVWRGGWLALARLARCRPGGSHGYDPVPPEGEISIPWYAPWRHGQWRGSRHDEVSEPKSSGQANEHRPR